jgi:predicted ATPase
MISRENRVVITGGPGTGKTSLLEDIKAPERHVMVDTAREIIRARHAKGLSSRPDPEQFGWDMLKADIHNYRLVDALTGTAFFDRSILDTLCYLDELSELGGDVRDSCLESYPYQRKVFILPPWQEIYTTDNERDQSFQECLEVDRAVRAWYQALDYELVEIPRVAINARVEFLMGQL